MRSLCLIPMTIVIAAATTTAPAAHAQATAGPASAPAEARAPGAESEQADAGFRLGNEMYKRGRYEEAAAAFAAAFRLKKAHDIAANLAYAEMKLGRMRDAAEHLSFAVRNWAPTGKEDKRRYAEERLAAAKKEVGALRITVNVTGAAVLVDGRESGVSPLDAEVFVEPGTRTIEARRSGYRDAKQVVEVKKGSDGALALTLEPAGVVAGGAGAETAPAGAGSQGVAPEGGGEPKPAGDEVPVGDGRAGARSGETGEAGPRTAVLIAGGAAAGAALVAGVILTAVANGKASDAERGTALLAQGDVICAPSGAAAADCLAVQDALAGKDTFSNAAVWSFIGAGVIGAGTMVYALTAPTRRTAPAALRVTPVIAAQGGGVTIAGTF